MVRYVTYIRVSTERQGQSRLGLDAQQAAVRNYIDWHPGEIVAQFEEIESGKRNDRPKLIAALAYARKHKATLVIAKLDRLARNVAFIATLMDTKGVDFVACDFPEANRLTLHILAAVAEHEAFMISERTKAALQTAKVNGKRIGGGDHHGAARAAYSAQAAARNASVWPMIEEVRKAGVTTLDGIAKALTARGIKTARGGAWSATQVSRVLAKAA